MAEGDLSAAQASDMENTNESWEIEGIVPFSATGLKETAYMNSDFYKYFSYYKKIPEVKIVLDTLAAWVIGDGYKTDDADTQVLLDHISGWGNDTFDGILENMVKVAGMGGDAFLEIIRADDGTLINLKPLDTGCIRVITDEKGIIIRYEQVAKNAKTGSKAVQKFKPEEIFHFTLNRVADEIHGTGYIEAVEDIIKANKESFNDMKQIQHNFVKPKLMVELDTDDTSKIDEFVQKFDAATAKGENLFYPKGTVSTPQVLAVPSNSTLNPMPWREHLKNYFFQVVGIPQVVLGSSGEFTESTAKIAYLAFEQTIKNRQREIIMQIWQQLQLRIDLAFPASLKNELISDNTKDMSGGMAGQMNVQPNEVTAGVGK